MFFKRRVRTSNGGEFTSNELLSFCDANGVKIGILYDYTPQKNGMADRKIRHDISIQEAEGMACATYVINRVPLSSANTRSP